MIKIVLLLKRAKRLEPVGFQRRWRAERAGIVAKVPGLRRYVQSHALLQGYAKGELLFDGIEELWFDTDGTLELATRSAAWGDDASRAMLDATRTVVMPVEVLVIKDGPIPNGAVKNIEFVNKRPGMDLMDFRKYWYDVHGPIASRIPVLERYEQNHMRLAEYERGAPPPYDGLAITWFHSTADMKRGTLSPEYAITRADEPHFLPDGHLPIIITREHEIDLSRYAS